MDPGTWAAYNQHYQRLGAGGVNPAGSPLTQPGQLNDLSLSRQDTIGGYGSPAPSLLLSHRGLNVSQGGHHSDAAAASFVNSSLLSSGYDPMISASFQSSAKGHLPPLNVSHSANIYKAMGVKEPEIGDLRGGFVRRGMPPSAMTSDPNMNMAASSGLFNPQGPPPHSWRHSNIVANPTNSPFGVLPHEAVLSRPGVSDSMDKLHPQDHRSKSSRMMMDTSRYMEQDLAAAAAAAAAAHSYAIMDHNSGSRGSLMMQQADSLGHGADNLGLAGLKASDYALYSNSNVNATRGLLPQNYIPQSHFPSPQDLQSDKRDLYDLSLLADKVEAYGGGSGPKSHLDLFGANAQPVGVNSNSLHGMNQQRPSHRSSSTSSHAHGTHSSHGGHGTHSGHSSHSRPLCSSQVQSRATTHSTTYTTYSATSTSYTQPYQASPQPSPSQPMHSPAHYPSPTAVDFTNTVPAHSGSQYPQTSSVLVHNNSPGVVYSSVITRANVPPSSTGTYTSPMTTHKIMSSKHHLSQNEPKLPVPTPPPPHQSPVGVQRNYDPVIRTPDIATENCMGDLVASNHNIPASLQRVANTPTGSTGGGSGGSLTPMDHSLIHSPAMSVGPPVGGRGSTDSTCTSPKSMSMETVFNSQQMTLQDLADMSSSNDKMDMDSGPVGLLPPAKESLIEEEPRLMDLSQPQAAQQAMQDTVLEQMRSNQLKAEEKAKKRKNRRKKKQIQEEEAAVAAAAAMQAVMNSANGPVGPGHLSPMLPIGIPTSNHSGQMCAPGQLYQSRSCMSSPMVSNNSNYSIANTAPPMYPSEVAAVGPCSENGSGFSQNGGLGVAEGLEPHMMPQMQQGIPPPSPPLASLFDPLPTSPQGNAEAAAFEEKLRNEASQIAKEKLDRRGPSIEDDLGFLAELPPVCNVTLEKRKVEVPKPSAAASGNFIDSFMRFLEGSENAGFDGSCTSNKHGGRGGRGGKSRETFISPPQGKNVELNPETGLFTCKGKMRGLPRGNMSRYQNSVSRRGKGNIKYEANPTSHQAKEDVIPAAAALTFSSDDEEGMANQGFVDSVKIALQSLSDNDGYDGNHATAPPSWGDSTFEGTEGQNPAGATWAASKTGSSESIPYDMPKPNSLPKIEPHMKDNWGMDKRDAAPNNAASFPAKSNPPGNDVEISDFSDKEFFDLALPRRESSSRKCKEKSAKKKKHKSSKRKWRLQGESHLPDSSSSESEEKSVRLFDSDANQAWKSVDKNLLGAKHPSSGSDDEASQKRTTGLRGRRKGYTAVVNPGGLPRGRPPGKRLLSPDGKPNNDSQGSPVKISRPRGRPKLCKYTESKDETKHIREGGFRSGEFIILLSDKNLANAPIWRIEGHGLIQKFEPFKEGDRTLYRGQPSSPGFKMGSRSFYEPATVLVVKGDKTNYVVEYLKDYQRVTTISHQGNKGQDDEESLTQKENFEVYLQTLISQVLDPNFISEIVKENDEYFLSHVHEIDGIVIKKKALLAKKIPWNTAMRDCAEHFPTISVRPFSAAGGGKLMCQACAKERVSLRNITFEGQLYDYTSLVLLREMPLGKKLDEREFSLCTDCTDMVQAYTHMHHQKYNLFVMCSNKVNSIRSLDPTQESHVILEQCLQDSTWINKLFCKIRNVWRACVQLCR